MAKVFDVAIIGGGTGGCAAAMAAASFGLKVLVAERCAWVGGQLTSQAVPPDEHRWIERFGSSERYRDFRRRIRASYRARSGYRTGGVYDNPGGGWVSRLCFEPRLGWETLLGMLDGVEIWTGCRPVEAPTTSGRIEGVRLVFNDGREEWVEAKVFLDGTEEGDLLPLANVPYVTGAESKAETGEPHALDGGPLPDRNQGITWCAALEWDPDGDHTIDAPPQYDYWRNRKPENWPLPLLSLQMLKAHEGEVVDFPLFARHPGEWFNLFSYRQIVDPERWDHPIRPATIVNWPQNDYYDAPTLDQPEEVRTRNLDSARQLTLSLIHWLQTEHGFRGLRLRPDLTGTSDGLAQFPYIRESRRLKARFTLTENHVAAACRPGADRGEEFADGVCIGAYPVDLHPSTDGGPTLDLRSLPFQIPYGCLLPQNPGNLLAAAKNIGVTHISNGCTRLHPVEWCVGEVAGTAAALSVLEDAPVEAFGSGARLAQLQDALQRQGVETQWPALGVL